MGNKKGNRKAEKAEEVVARDGQGGLVTIPLCLKSSTPRHADLLIPMPPPKNYRWYPHENFSMERTFFVREPPAAEPAAFCYDSSPLTGSADDKDVAAAKQRLKELLAEHKAVGTQVVQSEQESVDEDLEGADEALKSLWLSPATLYDVEGGEEDSPVFISEIMPGVPGIRFTRMTPAEAREAPNHTPTVWLAPTKFTLQTKTSWCWTLMMCDAEQFRIFAPPGCRTKTRRQILEQAFFYASEPRNSQSVNALYLLFGYARDAAVKNHNEELFAEALVNYIAAVRQLSFPTITLDLIMWGQECGRAFEAASLYPEHSAETRQDLRRKAVLAFKQAATDSMRSAVPKPQDVCQGWNHLGQALFRAGDLPMAVRAYRWGLHVSTALGENMHNEWKVLMDNLVLLGKLLKETAEEREKVRTDGLKTILHGEREKLPDVRHNKGTKCQGCGEMAHLHCVCKQVYYCSAECQKLDWKQHKPMCKRQRPANT